MINSNIHYPLAGNTVGRIDIVIALNNKEYATLLQNNLKHLPDFNCLYACNNGYDLLKFIQTSTNRTSVIIIDYDLEYVNAIESINIIKILVPEIEFVVITNYLSIPTLTQTIKSGALGFKPVEMLKNLGNYEQKETIIKDWETAVRKVDNGDYYFSKQYHSDVNITPEILKSRFLYKQSLEQINLIARNTHLTKRELLILYMFCTSLSKPQIAELLFISQKTLENHLAHISKKLKTNNSKNLLIQAIKLGIVNLAFIEKTEGLFQIQRG